MKGEPDNKIIKIENEEVNQVSRVQLRKQV